MVPLVSSNGPFENVSPNKESFCDHRNVKKVGIVSKGKDCDVCSFSVDLFSVCYQIYRETNLTIQAAAKEEEGQSQQDLAWNVTLYSGLCVKLKNLTLL